MTFDWEGWAKDVFSSCLEGIKECDPAKDRAAWNFYWDIMFHYRNYREDKSRAKVAED